MILPAYTSTKTAGIREEAKSSRVGNSRPSSGEVIDLSYKNINAHELQSLVVKYEGSNINVVKLGFNCLSDTGASPCYTLVR